MITMEHVCKSYKIAKRNAGFGEAVKALFHREYETVHALNDVTFTIDDGEFDRVLVRPRSEIIQVLGSKFELTRLGRMLQAIVMFVYGIVKSEITWNFPKILTVIFMLSGGTTVFTALFLIYAALYVAAIDSRFLPDPCSGVLEVWRKAL